MSRHVRRLDQRTRIHPGMCGRRHLDIFVSNGGGAARIFGQSRNLVREPPINRLAVFIDGRNIHALVSSSVSRIRFQNRRAMLPYELPKEA